MPGFIFSSYDVFGTAFLDKELFEEQKEKAKNQDMSEISLNDENNENISETDEIQIQNRIFTRYNGKGILGNTRLFTGREFDKESKLYYYRARYYDSETGRFISRDPIGIADDINLYSYVKNNPVMFTDPMGTEKKDLIIGFTGKKDSNKGKEIGDYNEIETGIVNVLKFFNTDTTKGYTPDHYGSAIDEAFNYIKNNQASYNKLIIMGHSLGGDNAVLLTNKLKKENINVDLLITLDIKSVYENDTIQDNVSKAYNYYQTNDKSVTLYGMKILSGEDIEKSFFNKKSIVYNEKVNSYNGNEVSHTNIDDLLQEHLIKTIQNNK